MTRNPLSAGAMVLYGLPPAPAAPGDFTPRDDPRPWVPLPPYETTTPGIPEKPSPSHVFSDGTVSLDKKPSHGSVATAITFIKRHFNLVLPPQDSRVQALAELLDLAFDVGASR